jgi:hypothetical protein
MSGTVAKTPKKPAAPPPPPEPKPISYRPRKATFIALHNYRHSFRYPPSYSVVIEEALELLFAREGIEIPDIPDDDQPSH